MDYMKMQQETEEKMDPTLERFQSFVFTRLQNDNDPEDVYYELMASGVDKKSAGMLISKVISKMIEKGLFDPTYFDSMKNVVPKEEQEQTVVDESNMQDDVSVQEEEDYDSSYDEETDRVTNQFFGDDLDSSVSKEETQGMVSQMKEGGNPEMAMNQLNNQREEVLPYDKIHDYFNPQAMIEFPSMSEYIRPYQPATWDELTKDEMAPEQLKLGGKPSKKKFVKNVMNLVQN